MTIIQAIILGIVQGVCEFLPISSSGHLVLFQNVFGINEGTLFFDVMLHVGTLAAVIVVYKDTIFKMLKRPFSKYPMYIVLATIPTVIIALLFKGVVDEAFSGSYLGWGFLITALLMLISSQIGKGQKALRSMNAVDALFMGTLQGGSALLPGISRSGATITGGLIMGLDQGFATEFSFLMSIPAILGSLVLQIYELSKTGVGHIQWGHVSIGMVFAAVFGYIAIRTMLRIVKKGSMHYFAIYAAVLGIFVLVDQHITHWFF